jgi:hypothetical protein
MGQQRDWLVFAFLTMLMVLLNGMFNTGGRIQSAIITTGIGASLISVPIWAMIGGLGFFGGLVGLLNLFRPGNKLKFSQITKANVGIALGLVLKLIFPSLP